MFHAGGPYEINEWQLNLNVICVNVRPYLHLVYNVLLGRSD